MGIILFLFFTTLTSILQVTFLPALEVWGAVPNLLLVVVLSWVILGEYKVAAWWAFLGGFLVDLYSGITFGLPSEARISKSSVASIPASSANTFTSESMFG